MATIQIVNADGQDVFDATGAQIAPVYTNEAWQVVPSGMPNGRNYYTYAAYPGPYVSERKTARNDDPVSFTIPTFQPVPGENHVAVGVWADADANMTNGVAAQVGFRMSGPR